MTRQKIKRGLMLIISSPSGAGKTSLCRRLVSDHDDLELSISVTTRKPRPGERDGREYHFISEAEMDRLVAADAFLEWAKVHDHRYGSLRDPVEAALLKPSLDTWTCHSETVSACAGRHCFWALEECLLPWPLNFATTCNEPCSQGWSGW